MCIVSENDKEPLSKTSESMMKQKRLEKLAKAKQSLQLPKIMILAVAWSVFGWALYSAWQAKINFKPYDPFELLGLSSNVGEDEIKNAFKKLSRIHHPDKASEDKRAEAEKKFVEISKAYKAIRKNWEEYGNPDGIRTFALGVALPSWLVNSSNRVILMALYCIAFGVGLPLVVKKWWTSSKEFTKDGLRHSSMGMFFKELKENSNLKKIVELLANAYEFTTDLPERPTDTTAMENLLKILDEYRDPNGDNYEGPKKKNNPLSALKAHALLYCHFHRIEVLDSDLQQDQVFIVAKAAQLVQGILQISLARQWLLPSINCMKLSQYLVQSAWESCSPLLQLPYITRDIARHATIGKRSIKSMSSLLDISETDRRSFLRSLTDDQYNELLEVAPTFPICNVEAVNFHILGQDNITPGGIITCQVLLSLEYPSIDTANAEVEIERNKERNEVKADEVQTFEFDEDGNLINDPGKKIVRVDMVPRPVYCPHFPTPKRPNWWVGLMNKNSTNLVSSPIKITDLIDRKTVTLQLPAPPKPMNVTIKLFIKSDSIIGVDIEKEVSFSVVPHTEAPSGESWDISGDEDDQTVPFADDE